MASSTLLERITAWRGTSAQVKLYFRRMRDGDIPPTTENMATFEGAMFAIDAEAADLLSEAARLVRETADVVQGALTLLDEAEGAGRMPTEVEVGQIVDLARQHRDQVRDVIAPVYVPNESRGYLQDMAVPASKPADNIIALFAGARRPRRHGGAS